MRGIGDNICLMRIDKSRPKLPLIERGPAILIWIDGRSVTAYQGESIAAVLAAEGIRTSRYSERQTEEPLPGFFCGMGICYGCIVLADGELRKACMTEIGEGMKILTQPARSTGSGGE